MLPLQDGQFYQNLVVCNYSVAGNLQGGTMYTQVSCQHLLKVTKPPHSGKSLYT